MLEKVFINKKFTQYKTSPTLQNNVFVITKNKNFGKLFSKYELLFFDQAHCSSDPCLISILQFSTLQSFPASLTIPVMFCPSQLKSRFNTIVIKFSIGFPILLYPIRPHVITVIGSTKPYAKPCQSFFLSSYIQVYPSKSGSFKNHFSFKVRLNGKQQSVSNTNYAEVYIKQQCSFIFTTLIMHTTTSTSSTKVPFSTLVNFHLPILPSLVHKILTNIPFLYTSAILHHLIFRTTIPTIHTKEFSYLSRLASSGYIKGPGSQEILLGLTLF